MLDCARFCVFAWFDSVTSFCGACVAQLSKKRHTVAASLRETCHEQQTRPRHLSLCSNTPTTPNKPRYSPSPCLLWSLELPLVVAICSHQSFLVATCRRL